jgi:hypothetical protein
MSFPLVTTAYFYAYEARPHGIVLGFCGIVLVCWQAATDRFDRRFWPLLGLGGGLVCALLMHSYAALLFVPVGLGELTRSVRLRRIDWKVWLTIAISSLTILVSALLFRAL